MYVYNSVQTFCVTYYKIDPKCRMHASKTPFRKILNFHFIFLLGITPIIRDKTRPESCIQRLLFPAIMQGLGSSRSPTQASALQSSTRLETWTCSLDLSYLLPYINIISPHSSHRSLSTFRNTHKPSTDQNATSIPLHQHPLSTIASLPNPPHIRPQPQLPLRLKLPRQLSNIVSE